MHKDSVETNRPPKQVDLVPADWTYIGDWDTDGKVSMELYVYMGHGVGRLIAIPQTGKAVRAAEVADVDSAFTLTWTGRINRDAAWQDEQRATALARYKSRKRAGRR